MDPTDDENMRKLREALDLAMRRLMAFPASRTREQLVAAAESISREIDAGQTSDVIRVKIASLHVMLAKAPPRKATKR